MQKRLVVIIFYYLLDKDTIKGVLKIKKDEVQDKGINPLTANLKYRQEYQKPIRKEQTVEEPPYHGLGMKYIPEDDESGTNNK